MNDNKHSAILFCFSNSQKLIVVLNSFRSIVICFVMEDKSGFGLSNDASVRSFSLSPYCHLLCVCYRPVNTICTQKLLVILSHLQVTKESSKPSSFYLLSDSPLIFFNSRDSCWLQLFMCFCWGYLIGALNYFFKRTQVFTIIRINCISLRRYNNFQFL